MNAAALRARRQQRPVLVPEVSAAGMIAVVRALGQSGYPVHAVSPSREALGLHSNYATRSAVHPPYGSDEFLPWLGDYVNEHSISAIVPSEAFYLGVRPHFARYADLLTGPGDEDLVYRCMSKCDYFADFLAAPDGHPVRARIPPTIVCRDGEPLPDIEQVKALGSPVYVKVDGGHAREGGAGEAAIFVEHAPAGVLERVRELQVGFDLVLVQGPAIGAKATVNICNHNGRELGRSMCLSTHENPWTGGLTTLRHTWWHQEMYEDAVERLRYLDWNGVAMVEYKYDPQTTHWEFIEINARFWAALHLDLFAGLDFPTVQLDAFHGEDVEPLDDAPLNLWARHTVPHDMGHIMSKARDKDLGLATRAATLIEGAALFLHPTMRSDYLYPGDRGLYWRAWRKFLVDLTR